MSNGAPEAATLPNTLILGSAKSGTTALFYAIRQAMERESGTHVKGLFEPRKMMAFRSYFAETQDPALLCKALLGPTMRNMSEALNRFDRKIVIFRDPRDNIVSRLLFMPPRLLARKGQASFDALVALIRQKEADPKSLSVVAILKEIERLSGEDHVLANFRMNAVHPAEVKRKFGDQFFMFPYEDLITNSFSDLSAYLGFTITPDFAVGAQHGYVTRGKGSGEWRSWFLNEDVTYFATEVAEDYLLLGFDPTEAPDAAPVINPDTGSTYLIKQAARHTDKRLQVKERRKERVAAMDPAEAVAQRRKRREAKIAVPTAQTA